MSFTSNALTISPTYYTKRVGWVRKYTWDFSAFAELLTEGETISAAPSSIPIISGDAALTVASITLDATKKLVQATVSAGTAGVNYILDCAVVTTPSGFDLSLQGGIACVP